MQGREVKKPGIQDWLVGRGSVRAGGLRGRRTYGGRQGMLEDVARPDPPDYRAFPNCDVEKGPRGLRTPALRSRLHSANAPTICIIIRPGAVVVSIASDKLLKPALSSLIRSRGNAEGAYSAHRLVTLNERDSSGRKSKKNVEYGTARRPYR